jgi:diaminopimelate epimerase
MAHFRKYHGLGNDYLVIDPQDFPLEPVPEAVRLICDRNYGIGSDGILLGPLPDPSGPTLRIFNPDGSEAEKSGNGLRIFSWYLFERGHVLTPEFPLRTKGGAVRARIVDAQERRVRMDMGAPDFDARGIAPGTGLAELLDREFVFGGETCRISCVSMGNPHCVVSGQVVTEALAKRLGPLIEQSPLFPARINVQFLEVVNPAEIRIEIWERGAGYTLASGSSSCAASAVARRLGLVGDHITARMPGGRLAIDFEAGTTFMTGPVEKVFEGIFSEELVRRVRDAERSLPRQ